MQAVKRHRFGRPHRRSHGQNVVAALVGLAPKSPAVTALPLTGPTADDVVLCDPVHQESLRAGGATGKLLWRLVVGQPIVAGPVRADPWLLLLTKDQRLLLIDPATGDSPRYFSLPQPVRLPPIVDAAHGLIVLAAEHSNLIVLDMNQPGAVKWPETTGKGPMPAGFARGTRGGPDRGASRGRRRFPPAAGQRYAQGSGNPRFLDFPRQGRRAAGAGADDPRAGFGRRRAGGPGHGAAVVTEQGGLYALDRSEADNQPPFQVAASRPASPKDKATHYLVSGSGAFWVADRTLTRTRSAAIASCKRRSRTRG